VSATFAAPVVPALIGSMRLHPGAQKQDQRSGGLLAPFLRTPWTLRMAISLRAPIAARNFVRSRWSAGDAEQYLDGTKHNRRRGGRDTLGILAARMVASRHLLSFGFRGPPSRFGLITPRPKTEPGGADAPSVPGVVARGRDFAKKMKSKRRFRRSFRGGGFP